MKIKIKGLDVLIDKEDLHFIKTRQYRHAINKEYPYLLRTKHLKNSRKTIILFLYREIMNCPKGLHVDHINGNVLDNRKINLRICTAADNGKNLKKKKNNISGYTGVVWHKLNQR